MIKHNFVKVRQIRSNLKRLNEAAVPILGALMNNVGRSGSAYYNSNYYTYNYDRYYADKTMAEEEPIITPRRGSVSKVESSES